MLARMRSQWDVVFLPMIHEESPNLPAILYGLNRLGWGGRIVERQPSRLINLPESWEAIEMSHGGNWRSNFRRKWKKMLAQHAGRALQGGLDLSPEEAFDALYMLHSQRWSPQESHFLRERAKDFHRKLVNRWLPEDRLSISILELDGAPGAATYCFHHDRRSWFYQAGWNARFSGISIGKMAIGWAVQCAIQRGHAAFDFLPGDMSYKQEWSNAVRHVVDFEAFNPTSPRSALFRLLRFCKRRTAPALPTPSSEKGEKDATE
jgi:CelD/BcsL family acetyltransferase involved in cellulose biosynthesis